MEQKCVLNIDTYYYFQWVSGALYPGGKVAGA
jgi:hypothetical protein